MTSAYQDLAKNPPRHQLRPLTEGLLQYHPNKISLLFSKLTFSKNVNSNKCLVFQKKILEFKKKHFQKIFKKFSKNLKFF